MLLHLSLQIPDSQFPVPPAQAAHDKAPLPGLQQHRRGPAVQQGAGSAADALADGAGGRDAQLDVAHDVVLLPRVGRHLRGVDQEALAHGVQEVGLPAKGEAQLGGLREDGEAARVVPVAEVEIRHQHLGREAGALVHQPFLQLHARSVLAHLLRDRCHLDHAWCYFIVFIWDVLRGKLGIDG